MPALVKTSLAATLTAVLLASGCSGDQGGGSASGAPASPTETASYCDEVSDEEASAWYGRPVTVEDNAGCSFQEEDYFDQDVNVMWELQPDTPADFAEVRTELGVRSDDATRIMLAGGVPAWEVRTHDVPGVMIATVVDGDLLFVVAMSTVLEKPYRPIPEMAVMARGIAESYTV